jgi:hypothetical protein
MRSAPRFDRQKPEELRMAHILIAFEPDTMSIRAHVRAA